MYTPDKLNQLMADSDYVVMALPYTQSTHHLVNAKAINAMRPNGVLINVGRGKTLEQDAIIKGACTDLLLLQSLMAEQSKAKQRAFPGNF